MLLIEPNRTNAIKRQIFSGEFQSNTKSIEWSNKRCFVVCLKNLFSMEKKLTFRVDEKSSKIRPMMGTLLRTHRAHGEHTQEIAFNFRPHRASH